MNPVTAHLLCPGPSLINYHPRTLRGCRHALRVGVNRAATIWECTHWVAGDPPLIQQVHETVLGNPLLITSVDGKHVYDTFPRDFGKPLWRGSCACWTEALGFCPHALQWVMFSATAALIWCAYSGAKRVVVFGADWKANAPDFDGVQAGKNRGTERFKLEREIWTNLVAWLGERGVKVQRIGVDA